MAPIDSPTARRRALAAALLAAATLAACGSGDEDDDGGGATTSGAAATAPATTGEAGGGGSGGGATRLALVAEESGGLRFDRSALSARPGEVTIALENPSPNQAPHAVEIEGQGVEEESATIQPGATAEVTASLRPGRYTFYCPVGDHRQQGMEGTLTVG